MKNIITIQHAQSLQHINGMIGSWTDWELTCLGKEQAEKLGKRLAGELKDQNWKIICSDLTRAKQTAAPLARYMGIEIEYNAKLREHNMGGACGKSKQWAKKNALPANSFDHRQFPGAESWREFWIRVESLCQDIIADNAENIILVSHGGTLFMWRLVWLGLDLQWYASSAAGGVSFMRMDESGKRTIQRINDLSYMEGKDGQCKR